MKYSKFEPNYVKFPTLKVEGATEKDVWVGYEAIVEELKQYEGKTIVVDTYPGVRDTEILHALQQGLKPNTIVTSIDCFYEKDELTRRMILMDEMGADILKIAVMPKSTTDVLELLLATEEMGRLYSDKPVITMSMGPLGLISRLAGETFGSALTFGAGEKASAPGQIPAKQLKDILNSIHENMNP